MGRDFSSIFNADGLPKLDEEALSHTVDLECTMRSAVYPTLLAMLGEGHSPKEFAAALAYTSGVLLGSMLREGHILGDVPDMDLLMADMAQAGFERGAGRPSQILVCIEEEVR